MSDEIFSKGAQEYADNYMTKKYGFRWIRSIDASSWPGRFEEWARAATHYDTPPVTDEVREIDSLLSGEGLIDDEEAIGGRAAIEAAYEAEVAAVVSESEARRSQDGH